VNCQFSAWSDWSSCSATCYELGSSPPRQTKRRTIARQAQHGGLDCDGDREDERECNTRTCPLRPSIGHAKYREGDWVQLGGGTKGLLTSDGSWDYASHAFTYYVNKGCATEQLNDIDLAAKALVMLVKENQRKKGEETLSPPKIEKVMEAQVKKTIPKPAPGTKDPCIESCEWRTAVDPVEIEKAGSDHQRCDGPTETTDSRGDNILVKDFGALKHEPAKWTISNMHRFSRHMHECREAVQQEPQCGRYLWFSYKTRKCMCKKKHAACKLAESPHPQRIEYYHCNEQQCAADTDSFDPDKNGNCACGNVKVGSQTKPTQCYRPNGPSGKVLKKGCPQSRSWTRRQSLGLTQFALECDDCVCCIVDEIGGKAPETIKLKDCRTREWDDIVRTKVN